LKGRGAFWRNRELIRGKLGGHISLPGLSGLKNQIKQKKQYLYLVWITDCKKNFTA
jgi:hypothetical protein